MATGLWSGSTSLSSGGGLWKGFTEFSEGGGLSPGSGSPTPIPYPLPTLAVAPAAIWYSVLVVPAYTGPLFQLVRASDSATLDVFAAAGSHIPDYAAIDAWAGGSAITYSIWYDQSGNGWHKTSTVAGERPSMLPATARNGIRPISYDSQTASGSPNKQMAFGTITGLNRQTMGTHTVINPRSSYEGRGFLNFANSPDTGVELFTAVFVENVNGNVAINSQATFSSSTLRLKARMQTLYMAQTDGGASGRIHSAGGVTFTGTGYGTGLSLDGIGREGPSDYGSSSRRTNHDNFGQILWNAAPTTTMRDALDAWAATLFAIPAAGTKNLVYQGSSLISGWTGTQSVTPPWLFSQANGDDWEVWNMGVGGRTLASEAGIYATATATRFNGGMAKNILVIDAPSNDGMVTFASEAAARTAADALYTNITTPTTGYIMAAKATGFSVVVPTIIARSAYTNANFREFFRDQYNTNVRNGAGANGYTVSDRAADSRLSNFDDTTYFFTDKTHLNNTGCAVLAGIDGAAVLSL